MIARTGRYHQIGVGIAIGIGIVPRRRYPPFRFDPDSDTDPEELSGVKENQRQRGENIHDCVSAEKPLHHETEEGCTLAKDVSFDICSTVDMQEVDNAVNQTNKEIGQRYDFKNSKAKVTMEDDGLKIIADDDFKLRSVVEILKTKLVNRKIPVKNLDYGKVENASGGTLRQMVKIQNGIDQDKARAIVKDIKGMGLKVQSQIMEAQVRVSGKNRDDMQAVIQMLRTKDYGIELQFGNYR